MKATYDMIEKWQKYGFLVVVLGWTKYGTVIGNLTVQMISLEDPRGYDEAIQPKDSSFDQSKGKKKHARMKGMGSTDKSANDKQRVQHKINQSQNTQ